MTITFCENLPIELQGIIFLLRRVPVLLWAVLATLLIHKEIITNSQFFFEANLNRFSPKLYLHTVYYPDTYRDNMQINTLSY